MTDIPTSFSEALRIQNSHVLSRLDRIIELLEAQVERKVCTCALPMPQMYQMSRCVQCGGQIPPKEK